jgi:hypothetical protein
MEDGSGLKVKVKVKAETASIQGNGKVTGWMAKQMPSMRLRQSWHLLYGLFILFIFIYFYL